MKKPPGYDNEIIYFNPKMLLQKEEKQKIKYYVCFKEHFISGDYWDMYAEHKDRWHLLGTTYAVSPQKAVNNVRYRNDLHHWRNEIDSLPFDTLHLTKYEAFTESEYKKLVKENEND